MPALLTILAAQFYADRARWVLWAPVLFGAGIGVYFSLPFEPSVYTIFLSPILLLIYAILRFRDYQVFSFVLLIVLLVVSGFSAAKIREIAVSEPVLQKKTFVQMSADVSSISASKSARKIILENISFAKTDFEGPTKLRLSYRLKGSVPKPGDRVQLSAFISPPPLPTHPGGFDFQRQLYFDAIGAVGFVTKLEVIENRINPFDEFLEQMRFNIGQAVSENTDETIQGFLLAITTGERNGLSKEVVEDMRQSGLAHLIAISGLHMGMIGGLIFFVVRFVGALVPNIALTLPIKKIAASVAIVSLLAYLALSGMSISAFRAFVMISLVFLAVCFDRTALSYRNLAIAAMVVLAIRPESLLGASFQMSFSAVFCLIAVYQEYGQKFLIRGQEKNLIIRVGYYLLGVLATSLVATIATAPFAIYHFGQVAIYGVLANMLAVPIMGFWVMPWVLVGLLLYPLGLMNYPLFLAGAGVKHIQQVADWVSSFENATWVVGSYSQVLLVLLILSALWIVIWRGWIRYVAIAGLLVGGVVQASAVKPDILISNSGKTVMLSQGNDLYFTNLKTDRFAREKWKVYMGNKGLEGKLYNIDLENTSCDEAGCVIEIAGVIVAISQNPFAYLLDCKHANLLISNSPVQRNCHSPDRIIDRFDIWRNGAHALYFNEQGHVTIETVNEVRGDRPWVPERFSRN